MQNPFRVLGAAATALALGIMLAACSGSTSATPPSTVTVIATSVATTTVTAQPTPTVQVTQQSYDNARVELGDQYLAEPSRSARFDAVVPKAGIPIAKALQAGQFGEVKRYDSYKLDLLPGYEGWGGISSLDNSMFAWVYWLPDGSIDYSKPISQISARHASLDPLTEVAIFGPLDNKDHWKVFKTVEGGYTEAGRIRGYINPENPDENGGWVYPTSVQELRALDDTALSQLDANMVSLFGEGWDN